MSDFLFKDFSPANPMDSIMEEDKVILYNDVRFAHPAIQDTWDQSAAAAMSQSFNPEMPDEAKAAAAEATRAAALSLYSNEGAEPTCDIAEYEVAGCVEEPETPVKVRVYRPKSLDSRKARTLFYICGGGLTMVLPEMFPIEQLCEQFNCVAIVPLYRTAWQGKYPAAINDLHAAYQWMLDNAEELGLNTKKVVLLGQSTGAHLSLSLSFRLKRYGITPRGVVAVVPQTDERETGTRTDYLYDFVWGAPSQHDSLMSWLGKNFGSGRIGPEALANHATVEDCVGLPPIFIHTAELDPDRDHNREFYGKLLQAMVYAEYHSWAGCHHSSDQWTGATLPGELNELSERTQKVIYGNIEDCFKYDLSRNWYWEENGMA